MSRHLRLIIAGVLALALCAPAAVDAAPEGQMTWALHFSLAPTLFEPAETPGVVSPFMILYALHDALLKPMPGQSMAPSLAESWRASPDGLVYEFVLRKGPRFHNGEPVTADDVKFSFEHEKVMYLPIWQLSVLNGYGSRVAESGMGLIAGYPWAAPYEEVRLKPR